MESKFKIGDRVYAIREKFIEPTQHSELFDKMLIINGVSLDKNGKINIDIEGYDWSIYADRFELAKHIELPLYQDLLEIEINDQV